MGPQRPVTQAWAVLLAGGDGTRLQALTARIEGDTRPKQFCRILGPETLLTQTRRRVSPLFDADRVITVVTRKHEPFYSGEFLGSRQKDLIVQPENRGTGAAIATAMLAVRGLDSQATVAVFPCDHHYADEGAFLAVIDAGIEIARRNCGAIVLVGAEAKYPEVEYGWIEPLQPEANRIPFAPGRVRRFWEKPAPATALELQRRGCLWNTFVVIGRAVTFIEMFAKAAPKSILALSAGVAENNLDSAYRSIAAIDFSHDVLASQPENLLVIQDDASGWTDLGSTNRVLDTLAREMIVPSWLESACDIEACEVNL